MATDPSDIEERAWVEHRQPETSNVEEPLWVAEDPETDCAGVGRVEAEAIGNLVAVVTESREPNGPDGPRMKLPGQTVPRPAGQHGSDGGSDDGRSLVESLRSLL